MAFILQKVIIIKNYYKIIFFNKMIQSIIFFLFGVYIGQEFGTNIPNVRQKTIEIWKELERTKFFGILEKKNK